MRYPVKKTALVIILTSLLGVGALFGEALQYKTGSMIFTFKGGTTLPSFIYFFKDNSLNEQRLYTGMGKGDNSTKLYPGGNFSLSFEGFTTPSISLGGELGYNFNYTIGETLFSIVPLYFKISYYPVQGKFDMPVSLGLGMGGHLRPKEFADFFHHPSDKMTALADTVNLLLSFYLYHPNCPLQSPVSTYGSSNQEFR